MEARQSDKLELITHGRELLLKLRDSRVIQLLFPMEGRRAVIGEYLARIPGMDRFREAARLGKVRLRSFAPDHVGVRGVGQASGDGRLNAATKTEEALGRPHAGQKWL